MRLWLSTHVLRLSVCMYVCVCVCVCVCVFVCVCVHPSIHLSFMHPADHRVDAVVRI